MFATRPQAVVFCTAIAMAVMVPLTGSLAQGGGGAAPAATPGPFDYPGANKDYNISQRSDADKALPHPYALNETWFTMPSGRTLGGASGIGVDKDGKSIWVAERCGGQDLCVKSHVAPVMKFDANGNFVKAIGADQIVYPHGLWVDADGNIWVTDLQSNVDRPAPRNGPKPTPPPGMVPNGAQVLKFSPDGKILLRLGTPGVYGNDATHFSQPSAVITAPNGDIFVADGHDSAPANSRIVKFDKTGKFIKAWPTCQPGAERQIDCSHALAMDSQGRLFVGDRGNNQINIFDQDGKLLATWKQFGKPSGLYIDKNDVLYVADSESGVAQTNAFIRGIHVGSAKTGVVTAFMADARGNAAPWNPLRGTTGSEGVTADKDGIIYSSQVTPPGLNRYTLKKPGFP